MPLATLGKKKALEKGTKGKFRDSSIPILLSKEFASDTIVLVRVSSN